MRNAASRRSLTPARITRLLALLRTPAAASRACERVYGLSRQALSYEAQTALLSLSNALNEHRHAILAGFRSDAKALAEHTASRDAEIRYALRAVARAA